MKLGRLQNGLSVEDAVEDAMDERYPVELFVRSIHTRFQAGFAKLATLLLPETEGILYEPSSEGLRLLAEQEHALQTAANRLLEVFPGEVELGGPRPHLIYTDALREPIMTVDITVHPDRFEIVLADLRRRGALVETTRRSESGSEMRGRVRLAAIIGYSRDLEALTGGAGTVEMHLSHYEAVPGNEESTRDMRVSPRG